MEPEETEKSEVTENKDSDLATTTKDNSIEPSNTAINNQVVSRGRSKKRKILIIFGGILVVVLSGLGGGYIEHQRLSSKPSSKTTSTANDVKVARQIEDKKAVDNPVTLADNTYLPVPKVLGDLKFFKDPKEQSSDPFQYFQVGTTKDNKKIIVAYYTPQGIGGPQDYVALGNTDGSYEIITSLTPYLQDLISKPEDATSLDYFKQSLSDNVKLNASINLPELSFPVETTVNNQALTVNAYSREFLPGGIDDLSNKKVVLTKISDVGGVTFYKSIKENTTFDSVLIYASTKNMYLTTYKLNTPVLADSAKLTATWTSGENNNTSYFSAAAGCGSMGSYIIAKNLDKNQLKQVGTAAGKTLYQLPLANPLAKELYDQDYKKGEYLSDTSLKNLSLQQFTDKHAYFLVQNDFGEYNVLQRDDMFIRGGCAKPVIYLYPTRPTQVSVQVGADVTKSFPFYPVTGWRGVTAMPNGKLLYQGVNYSSLFWEGFGHGQYPEVTSGTIVSGDNLVDLIREQLAAQGLNQKEITDFVSFWSPKLPKTPYSQLSWLTKGQIDELAPLSISPKPATTIRVFMDVRGITKPIDLPAPSFVPAERNGFTVVEWGGLSKDGSVPKAR